MNELSAARSGTLLIGGDVSVNRLGYGTMRLTGKGIWGPPADRAEALRVLKRLPELGVNFIDTADSYGPDVADNCCAKHCIPIAANSSPPKAVWCAPAPISGPPSAVPNI